MNKPITLLIADDDQTFRQSIQHAVRESDQILVVGEAVNGDQALELTGQLHPNVILLNMEIPRLNGILAVRLINQLCPGCKIITFSQYASKEVVLDAIRSGAEGYLVKDSRTATEIVQVIQAVANGLVILNPLMLGWVLDELTGSNNGNPLV